MLAPSAAEAFATLEQQQDLTNTLSGLGSGQNQFATQLGQVAGSVSNIEGPGLWGLSGRIAQANTDH